MARALCVLIGCAGVAVAPATVVAREIQAPAGEGEVLESPVAATPEGPAEASQPAAPPAVTVTSGARLPAIEVVTAKKVRHDVYAGFAFGVGAGNFRVGGGTSAALTGLVRVGGRLTDKIAMGGLVVTSFGGSKTGVSGFSNLLAEALFFPVKGRGLGIAVAVGLSSAWLRVPDMNGMLVDRSTRTGGAFGLGLGYDFWLARRFNLGIWMRGDGSGGGYGLRAAGSLGLAFAWY